MVFITGDKHGDFRKIYEFVDKYRKKLDLNKEKDFMVILGDAGINYYLHGRDVKLKKKLAKLPLTFICIHGNHEERPQHIKTYEWKYILKENIMGLFFYERQYPNILFPFMGSLFRLEKTTYWHLGGAWSFDKERRLEVTAAGYKDFNWYPSEQMTQEERDECLARVRNLPKDITILSHTCPIKYEPVDMYLPFDVSEVDKTMEIFLDEIEEKVDYKKWYCGHWHTDRVIDKIRFVYDDIIESGEE